MTSADPDEPGGHAGAPDVHPQLALGEVDLIVQELREVFQG